MTVHVVPHDPKWKEAFAFEAARIRDVLMNIPVEVHHIGSTAIPDIYAKPIIDMLLVVQSLESLDSEAGKIVSLGYEAKGEFGIAGRRYFRKDDEGGNRTHHLHAFERNSDGHRRHLAFREYLRSHPGAAQEYSALKQHLVNAYPFSSLAYIDGKDSFVKHYESLALSWQGRKSQND